MSSSTQWHAANGASLPDNTSKPFVVTAPPKTDIWRPNPAEDVFTAPNIYTTIQPFTFQKLSVTVSAVWQTRYDQGGFLLAFPRSDGPWRWIKAGIEFEKGAPCLGVVGTDRFSDWSLNPMQPGKVQATFEAVREGTTLWVYATVGDAHPVRQPLREIKWAFLDSEEGKGELRVGVYAAKPTPEEGDAEKGLDVSFSNLAVETTS
ncbi:hypothetical protein BAUCODRAFT_254445 [Baudoinia panamericana UAMH 10762]|uniref:Uncharacterized protein n=1 Tax=Baudoinia panamericana (strain UAMH 10762) TaxID=717646 RepID=M2N1R6_BAUPA|nr:uncharacterized protein BAUCODRAFT_254445 [Baudoinia panamericana UAMH 10762]EMC92585.1 hypothetical protein BAUCODRAFT_254445 [Baudoinia panamericana UAMH 10762]